MHAGSIISESVMSIDSAKSDSYAVVDQQKEFFLRLTLNQEDGTQKTHRIGICTIFDNERKLASYGKLVDWIAEAVRFEIDVNALDLTYRDSDNIEVTVISSKELSDAIDQFYQKGIMDFKCYVRRGRGPMGSAYQVSDTHNEETVIAKIETVLSKIVRDLEERINTDRHGMIDIEDHIIATQGKIDEIKDFIGSQSNHITSKLGELEARVNDNQGKTAQDSVDKIKKVAGSEMERLMCARSHPHDATEDSSACIGLDKGLLVNIPTIRFDPLHATKCYSFEYRNLRVTKNVNYGWGGCAYGTECFTSGCSFVSFRVESRGTNGHLMIGISDNNENVSLRFPGDGKDPGCALYLHNGHLYHSNTNKASLNNGLVKQASVIGLLLNMDDNVATFYADGQHVETVTGDVLTAERYFPVVALHDAGASVSISDVL